LFIGLWLIKGSLAITSSARSLGKTAICTFQTGHVWNLWQLHRYFNKCLMKKNSQSFVWILLVLKLIFVHLLFEPTFYSINLPHISKFHSKFVSCSRMTDSRRQLHFIHFSQKMQFIEQKKIFEPKKIHSKKFEKNV
jgi:hypothetical protein